MDVPIISSLWNVNEEDEVNDMTDNIMSDPSWELNPGNRSFRN